MEIKVNGKKGNYPEPFTVGALLNVLKVDSRTVVVERNLEILERSAMERQPIFDGDSIEIIRFVGGG